MNRHLSLCFALTAATLAPRFAMADDASEPVAPPAVTDAGPNRLLLTTGAVSFGFGYGAALWVGATSERKSDRALLIPFAGPLMALATRGPCGGDGVRSCVNEAFYDALIIADAALELGGATQVFLAFLKRELVVDEARPPKVARLTIAPLGLGVLAAGTF